MKIEVVPRFRIDGKWYTADELPEEKVQEYIMQKVTPAMSGMNFERKKTA